MTEIKYQIFISSTYTDLIKEREGIIQAILEMYHIPIGMEMFSAEDEDQWEIIRRTIEVSDYYILVLGLRYGSTTSDNISFTQKEYEYAIEKNIPVLAFVMDENVSLSQDKRDNDLTSISEFRNIVLKNSRMAQFWTTKDELIKNISISLMKQIMQKPGVGWVRGDKIISAEAQSNELTSLSKENRELRDTIKELESKITPKAPKIELSINDLVVDDQFYAYKKATLPEKIDINNIDEKLREYITEEEIIEFNNNIPSQTEIDEYNDKYEKYYKIKKYSENLAINICNTGTSKANNLYIDISFPESLLVIDNEQTNNEPESPIPYTPIKRAEKRYKTALDEANKEKQGAVNKSPIDMLLGKNIIGRAGMESVHQAFNLPKIRPVNQTWWTRLKGNKLTIKINNLLHTRCMNFDDEYMIVPLATGVHSIEVSIICEEFETTNTQTIEIDVKEKL